MAKNSGPQTVCIGDTEYHNITTLQVALQMSRIAAHKLLDSLHVPILYLQDGQYFLMASLEEALYAMMQVGEIGFMAPGSWQKRMKSKTTNAHVKLPDKYLDPETRDDIRKRLKQHKETRKRYKSGAFLERLRGKSGKN